MMYLAIDWILPLLVLFLIAKGDSFRVMSPLSLVSTLDSRIVTPPIEPRRRHYSQRRLPSTSLQAQREATFGMGCFWKPSEQLLQVEGVIDTVVGYTGKADAQSAPNYEIVCASRDWVEGVRVIYDDEKISYAQLLDAFFECQEPKLGSRQYGSFIFPHDRTQTAVAGEWLAANRQRIRSDGVTGGFTIMEELTSFWRAEEYHQRYWQKMRPRIACWLALTAMGSGILDDTLPQQYVGLAHTTANSVILVGLIYVLLERVINAKVIQLS